MIYKRKYELVSIGLGLLFILTFTNVSGQAFPRLKTANHSWFIGVNTGLTPFWGDLSVNDKSIFSKLSEESSIAFGFTVGKQMGPYFNIHGNFVSGKLTGSRPYSDIYFETSFYEESIELDLNVGNLVAGGKSDSPFHYYITAGLGMMDYRVISRKISTDEFIDAYGYVSEGNVKSKRVKELIFPLGIKVDYQFDKNWAACVAYASREMDTDKLDATIGSTGISDRYSYLNVGLSYTFTSSRIKSRHNRSSSKSLYHVRSKWLKRYRLSR